MSLSVNCVEKLLKDKNVNNSSKYHHISNDLIASIQKLNYDTHIQLDLEPITSRTVVTKPPIRISRKKLPNTHVKSKQ